MFLNLIDADSSIAKTFSRAEKRKAFVRRICHRKTGIGADGFVFIESSNEVDFAWDFYNSDGSVAEMCGNAARCVTYLAHELGICNNPMKFSTLAGVIEGKVESSDRIIIDITPISEAQFQQSLEWKETNIGFSRINTGVPHAVIKVEEKGEDLESEKNYLLAQFMRSHKIFGSSGTNVTYYKMLDDQTIQSVSFERGVENFTLACGTGVVAAAYDFYKQTRKGEVKVKVPGGCLSVQFFQARPRLIGPIQLIAQCQLSEQMLQF